jgi:hypothetical protein
VTQSDDNLSQSRTRKIEDLGIAPWDIMNHEPWKTMALPHLAFHAWARSPKAKFDNVVYRTAKDPNEKEWSIKNIQEIKIERQPFRHVDNVLFEHTMIGENFIKAWRDTGLQHYGFLYGRYVKDEKIPLGITCLISCIFTPSCWRPMAEDELTRADNFAAKFFGLKRVGWIWSALGPQKSANRQENNPLISNEIYYMSKYQQEFPNLSRKSESGQFGSKFVSVLAFDTKEGQPHLRSFQLSNQASQLVHYRNIKVSNKHHNTFYINKSNEKWEFPSILYNETTGEEGDRKTVEKKAEGHYLPADVVPFFLVTQPVTFPREPKLELFASFIFPCVYDKRTKHGTWRDAKRVIDEYMKLGDVDSLRDFHFLLWLWNNLKNEELVEKLIETIKRKDKPMEIISQIVAVGSNLFPMQPLSNSRETNTNNSNNNGKFNDNIIKREEVAQIAKSMPSVKVNVEHKTTLMVMFGCTEQKAEQVLIATDNNIDAAANLILSEM